MTCRNIEPGIPSDGPCPDCKHRVGSHSVVPGGGSCDICDIIAHLNPPVPLEPPWPKEAEEAWLAYFNPPDGAARP